jgi:hypothetical protein
MSTSSNIGPLGQPRGVGFGILMYIVTFGVYSFYWVYKTQEEMKQHTGEGLGGVLGLVVWLLINPVTAFVIPSEIGKMYKKDGQEPPMTGWTGLWLFPGAILLVPAIVLVRESTASPQSLLGGESSRAWSRRLIDGAYQRWNDATTIMRRNLRADLERAPQ